MNPDKHIPIKRGDQLEPFDWPRLFDREYMGKIAATANAILNMRGGGSNVAATGVTFNPTTNTTLHIRGEYNPETKYVADDIVVITDGDSAGSYGCVKDNPGASNPPDMGNGYWITLAKGNTIGNWL